MASSGGGKEAMVTIQDLIPVGSVVTLRGARKKCVIIGIMQSRDDDVKERVYDYLGVPYPEGYLGDGSCLAFDHEDVDDIVWRGYENPERGRFLEAIAEILQKN